MLVFGRFVFCCAILFASLSISSAAPAKKRNVLFIAVDDLKPLLGCYGDTIVKSPNFDRLAARGLLFERAYCNQAVCAPSRNALLTGRRPQSLGIYDLGTNFRKAVPDAITLPQAFRNAGYRTEALGKIFHVGHGNYEDPVSWTVPHWQAKTIAYASPESRAKGLTREEALFANSKSPVQKLPRGPAFEAADVDDAGYPDGILANEAIRRLRAASEKPNEPWFIAIGFLKPHLPFCAPKRYWDLYDPAQFTVPALRTPPEGAPSFAPTNWGELRQYSDIPETGPLTDAQARQLIHGYYATVSYVDAQLGRVLAALDELGLARDTTIVLWGDHGWHLGDHGQWCKHTNYEEAAHIPLIMVAPEIAAGRRTNALVESVDIYPTLCELAGISAPPNLDGQSFTALLQNASAPTKDAVFHVYPRDDLIGRAVRTARFRLIEWKKPDAPAESAILELYDYQQDPAEKKNHASEQTAVVNELRAVLARQPEAKPQIKSAADEAKVASDRAAMFARRDKDADGQLTREEFLDKQPDPAAAPKRFERFDVNHDGVLSREEFITMGGTAKK